MTPRPGYALFCPRCGRKLCEHVDGSFTFKCPRCKSMIGGETKAPELGHVVTVVTTLFDPGKEAP